MISVCIITKNESSNLNICLSRLEPYNFELVVVDTGSTDDTKTIASKYTSNIYDFDWCDDFSAARNFAITKANNEYILFLDTDEFLDNLDYELLLNLIKKYPDRVGKIHIKNLFDSNGEEKSSNEFISRFFPKKLYNYSGRIHEQLTLKDNPTGVIEYYDTPIFVTHTGYQGNSEYKKAKAHRNLTLLLKELEENGDDPYILYQIGRSYFYAQNYTDAIPYFERAMELNLDLNLDYVHTLVITFGYCLIYTEQFQRAMMLEGVYEDFKNDADFLFVMGLIYMYNAQFNKAIENFLTATTIPNCSVEGVNSFSAFYNVGVILECLNDKTNAITYYKKCGDYPPALEGVTRCS